MASKSADPISMPSGLFHFAPAPLDEPIDELLTQPIVPSTPEPAKAVEVKPVDALESPTYSAAFITDNSIVDGHVFPSGAEFVKSWRLKNDGNVAWPSSTVLAFIGGDRFADSPTSPMTYPVGAVAAGAHVDVHADMKAPGVGRHVSYWRLRDDKSGKTFGDQFWCDISVEDDISNSSMSSSIVMMPAAAPTAQEEEVDDGVQVSPTSPDADVDVETIPASPSTMRSSSPTEWSTTSGSSIWEDARPTPATGTEPSLRRAPSTEFVFIDDDDMSEGEHHF